MIIRELAAKLGLDIDIKSFVDAKSLLDLAAAGMRKVADFASDLVERVNKVAESADQIDGLAQAAGVTTDAFQRMAELGEREGIAVERMGVNLVTLSRNMKKVVPGAKTVDEAFEKLIERFSQMPDGQKKTQMALDAFGLGAKEMLPLLNGGTEALEAMRHATVMSPAEIAAGKALIAIQRQLALQTKFLWREALAPLLPAITALYKQLLAWKKQNAEIIKQRVRQWMGYVIAAIKRMGEALSFLIDHWRLFAAVLGTVMAIKATRFLGDLAIEAWKAGAKIGAAGFLATAGWAALAAIIATIIGVMQDIDTFRKVEQWNKLHPERQLDPKKYSLFGRFKDTLSEWLKPNANDPWWVKAAKDLVAYLSEALGVAKDLGLLVDKKKPATTTGKAVKTAGSVLETTGDVLGEVAFGVTHPGDVLRRARAFVRRPWTQPAAAAPQAYAQPGEGTVLAPQVTQQWNITQLPGEDGPAFAERVVGVMKREGVVTGTELEHAAAAAPAGQ